MFGRKEDRPNGRPPINFEELAQQIGETTRSAARGSPEDYAPPPRGRQQGPIDKARATTLNEVGLFRELSLSELDKLLGDMMEKTEEVLNLAKVFRVNIERSHEVLKQKILEHSQSCQAAMDFFNQFNLRASNLIEPPKTAEEERPNAEG